MSIGDTAPAERFAKLCVLRRRWVGTECQLGSEVSIANVRSQILFFLGVLYTAALESSYKIKRLRHSGDYLSALK